MTGGLTKPQKAALAWLRNRNGDGVWTRKGAGPLLAAGEIAPVMRATWNALAEAGLVELYAERKRLRVTDAGRAVDLRGVCESIGGEA